jgi:hypothetical protein
MALPMTSDAGGTVGDGTVYETPLLEICREKLDPLVLEICRICEENKIAFLAAEIAGGNCIVVVNGGGVYAVVHRDGKVI